MPIHIRIDPAPINPRQYSFHKCGHAHWPAVPRHVQVVLINITALTTLQSSTTSPVAKDPRFTPYLSTRSEDALGQARGIL